jgi:large subunit ribosomal protein L25
VSLQDYVEVEALPTDLPSSIEIDVTTLTEVGQSVSLADIKLGEAVTLVLAEDQDPAETMLVMIQAEQQEEPEAESSDSTELPEVIGEKKDDASEEAKSESAAE